MKVSDKNSKKNTDDSSSKSASQTIKEGLSRKLASVLNTQPSESSPQKRRSVKFTSVYFLSRAEQTWWVLLCSLPLDLIAYDTAKESLAAPMFIQLGFLLTIVAGLVTLLGILRGHLIRIARQVGEARTKFLTSSNRPWIIILTVIVIGGAIELLARFSHVPPVSRLVALIVGSVALWRTTKLFLESKKQLEVIKNDKIAWIEHSNRTVFLIHVVPLAAARFVSLGAVLASIPLEDPLLITGTPLSVWVAILVGLLAMIALRPLREEFVIKCSRCGFPTSRVLEALRVCPSCSPETFWGKTTQSSPTSSVKKAPK